MGDFLWLILQCAWWIICTIFKIIWGIIATLGDIVGFIWNLSLFHFLGLVGLVVVAAFGLYASAEYAKSRKESYRRTSPRGRRDLEKELNDEDDCEEEEEDQEEYEDQASNNDDQEHEPENPEDLDEGLDSARDRALERRYAKVLGLSGRYKRNEIASVVKAARRKTAKQCHPDAHASKSAEIERVAVKKMQEINRAADFFLEKYSTSQAE